MFTSVGGTCARHRLTTVLAVLSRDGARKMELWSLLWSKEVCDVGSTKYKLGGYLLGGSMPVTCDHSG
ncbi:hypothetical protein RRG08_047610 [Elysia crispata]|uniref:Uncharacterized protein n=1 Tax=Elysia crispata TaxID=231223 RepID=A0AAE1BDI0_9GAST|nr:hypothetical protein RRG08_047610 [Elysia crispata]